MPSAMSAPSLSVGLDRAAATVGQARIAARRVSSGVFRSSSRRPGREGGKEGRKEREVRGRGEGSEGEGGGRV